MLDKLFQLQQNKTTVKTEIMAGLTTFLTMSYILFVNPAILSLTGMDAGAVFVATCLAAAFSSALMGLLANYPIALAPGMGLNAYFTYSVVLGSHHTWQVALGAVFLSGILFLLISILPIRAHIIQCIPKSLKVAIVGGIGLFLGLIGMKNAGIVVPNTTTLLTLGNLHSPTTLLAIAGFFLMISLEALNVIGAIVISILAVTTLGLMLGYGEFKGVFSLPPSLLPTFLQMDIKGACDLGLATIVFAFLFVDLFDNTGTLLGIAHRAGIIDKDGNLPRMRRALIADSSAAVLSAIMGTSTTTSFVESIVGVKAGGRTGLTAVVVALLFLVSLILSPLAHSIPIYATAPALIYVACLMSRALTEIEWDDLTESVPAILAAMTMPLTFSIADGISFGFISYTAIKLFTGRVRELNLPIVLIALAFVAKFSFL